MPNYEGSLKGCPDVPQLGRQWPDAGLQNVSRLVSGVWRPNRGRPFPSAQQSVPAGRATVKLLDTEPSGGIRLSWSRFVVVWAEKSFVFKPLT